MLNKVTIIAAFIVASININAQTVTKKCPDCPELTKWQYNSVGFVETLKNPDLNAFVRINWETKEITTEDGTTYPLDFRTNERKQTQTYLYGGQKLIMFFNQKAEYIGHKVENQDTK
jgi:hypothetical protein